MDKIDLKNGLKGTERGMLRTPPNPCKEMGTFPISRPGNEECPRFFSGDA